MTTEYTARELLNKIDIGSYNATMVVPFLFLAPATTDPKSPPVMLLVGALQRELEMQGYAVPQAGYLDLATARVLSEVIGDRWMAMTWADNLAAVLRARRAGPANARHQPVAVAVRPQGVGVFDFLPDVPGGMVTYGVAAYFLYKHLKKRA